MQGAVQVSVARGVMAVLLDRPAVLNSFDDAMHAGLRAALGRAAAEAGVRAVLLHGAGQGFCAGADLGDVGPGQDLGADLENKFNPLVRLIRGLPKPVVCAVHGVAAGAGANIALACDIVVAGEGARFIQAFVKIGLLPDAGGTWTLPRLVGDARARAMALLGDAVSGAEAAAWGMVWRAVPDERVLEEAQAIAARLAGMPAGALAAIKRAFAVSGAHTLEQQLDHERDAQRALGGTADFREGVHAFLEKRSPHFEGAPE